MADYYVDPSIGANTGAGTLGDPWGHTGNEIQKALDNITKAATGDNLHVKSTGTVDFAATNLNFATYGTPGLESPFSIYGYTSEARDGGRATINLNGASTFTATSQNGIQLGNLDISGGTGAYQFQASSYCVVDNCLIVATSTGGIYISGTGGVVSGCYISGQTGIGIRVATGARVLNNFISGSSTADAGILCGAAYPTVVGNVVIINHTGSEPAIRGHDVAYIANNTIYSTVAATCEGIELLSIHETVTVQNNYIEGLSGAGGEAYAFDSGSVVVLYKNNRWFNCTSGETLSGVIVFNSNNSATTLSGLSDAALSDYTPTVELIAAGFPQDFLNLAGNKTFIDIGAIQARNQAATTPRTREWFSGGVGINEAISTSEIYVPTMRDIGL